MKTKSNIRELEVLSSTENLSLIRNFIQSAANEFGISEDTIGKILLAVDEACTNVILHAYKGNDDGIIKILLILDKEKNKLRITVKDKGKHFNPKNIPVPDLAKYHKEKRIGGLGMFLMKKLMDKVEYNTLSDGTNKLIMVKNLS